MNNLFMINLSKASFYIMRFRKDGSLDIKLKIFLLLAYAARMDLWIYHRGYSDWL